MATQGPRFPGTTANLSNAGTSESAEAWVNPGNVAADDATEASITAATYDSPDISQLLVCSNFGFTIPAGSTINGITVEIDRRSIIASSGKDFRVQLAKGTAFANLVGSNKAVPATIWPSTTAVATYGGAADLWGATFTDAEINASSFAVMISCQANIANADVGIDFVRITVDYTGPTVAPATPDTGSGSDASTEVGSYVPTEAGSGSDVSNRVSDKSAALVVGDSANLTGLDTILKNRLIALGYTVFIVDDGAAADLTRNLVVIAETITSGNVTTKYRNASMPVINLDHALNDDMDFISAASSPGGNEDNIVILDSAHPMANGNTGTVLVQPTAVRMDYSDSSVLAASAQQVYSTEASSTQIVCYGFDAGAALLNAHTAEARRVFIGLFPEASGGFLNATGLALFDAAVTWAATVAGSSKNGSDPGSGSDASGLAAALSLVESPAGSDIAAQGAIAPVTAEAGTGADTSAVQVPAPATGEAGTSSEARTLAASLTPAETPTGGDTSQQNATAPATADSGSGADVSAVTVPAPATGETGSSSDVSTETAVQVRPEPSSGSDVSTPAAAQLRTDSGAGADVSTVVDQGNVTQAADNGSGADASTEAASYASPEPGAALDGSTELVGHVRADAAAGADASTVTQGAVNLQATDAGAAVDTSSAAATITAGEPATAADGATLAVVLTRPDAGAALDASAILRLYAQSDAGTPVELAALTARYVATDSGIGTDDSERIGGRFVQMVRALIGSALPGVDQDPSDSEPFTFRPETLYVWEELDRQSPLAAERRDFLIRAVYVVDDDGERSGLPRSREASLKLQAAADAMTDVIRLAYGAGVWDHATATIDPTLARAYGVRGIGLRIAGYRLL